MSNDDEKALSARDIDVILESLNYTKLRIESTEYPTYEMKRQKIEEIESAIEKIRALR